MEARLAHPCFPQPAHPATPVWHYMDLGKLVWLLDRQRLHFSRLDLLEDPHEGALTRRTAAEVDALAHGPDPAAAADLVRFFRQARQSTYSNSWYLGEHESEAMWRLYCPGAEGVALQTRYAGLVETAASHPALFVGCVRYIDYEREVFPEPNVYYPAMHKRIAFEHEREVRLVTCLDAHLAPDAPPGPPGIEIEWAPAQYVETLYIDPYAPGFFAEAVRAVVRCLAPALEPRIVWSRLRVAPLY